MNDFKILSFDRLKESLDRITTARIAVLGDFCLDVYFFIDMSASEKSLETGKQTLPIKIQQYTLGGAGNVIANLHEMGVGRLDAYGAVGDDPFGNRMLSLLQAGKVNCDHMLKLADESWQTLTYCKPLLGDEEKPRFDIGNYNALPDRHARELIRRLEHNLPSYDLVLVNQQVKTGIHTPCMQALLSDLIARHDERIFIYDGRHIKNIYTHAWLKANDREVLSLCGIEKDLFELLAYDDVVTAGKEIYQKYGKPLFITRGARGCIVISEKGVQKIPGVQVLGKIDTVGAGDSFLAGMSAAIAVGMDFNQTAQMGNLASAVTIQKIGRTGTASRDEILDVGKTPNFIFEPELAEDRRLARYYKTTEIEIVHPLPSTIKIEYAIFDHDGTISTLRQGWEAVMQPMMVRAILGEKYDSADESDYHNVRERVRRYIDQTTGIQTLSQMEGLVNMVKEFGFVDPENILDAAGYKEIYNQALMKRVDRRLKRFCQNELDLADFTIKNAVIFLQKLYEKGIKLYLASGTDVEDVIAEARALGYADLFKGNIYGSVGKIEKEAKQIVLDRILKDIGDVGGKLVTFGDGPVEIRETRRRGGLPVGIASDEIRRYELNLEKRTRLIRAGAFVIIPDFSQMEQLTDLFNI